jgi:hypothetical protein
MSIVLAKILLYENQPHMRRAHHTAHSTPRARRSAGHRLSIRPHGGMCRAGVLCGAEVKQVSRVHRRPPPRSRTRTRTPREPEPVRAQRPSRPRSASPSAVAPCAAASALLFLWRRRKENNHSHD